MLKSMEKKSEKPLVGWTGGEQTESPLQWNREGTNKLRRHKSVKTLERGILLQASVRWKEFSKIDYYVINVKVHVYCFDNVTMGPEDYI